MAAPPNKTVANLNGKWVLNKTLSDSTDPALALQGIGWMLRKTIGLATVTIHVKQYTGPAKPGGAADAPADATYTHIDIEQTATGGIKGNSEHRCLDWSPRAHSDWLFGNCEARNRWISAAAIAAGGGDAGGDVGEVIGGNEPAFLAEGWIEDEAEQGGPDGESHVLNYVKNLDRGWTAVQIWGFQLIGGERRYARNVVVKDKNGKVEKLKMVYDWISE